MTRRRVALAGAVLVILVATLTPGAGPPIPERCLLCGDDALADVLRNVALFAPLGAALAANGCRPGRSVLLGVLLSAAVESAQVFIPGRDASVSDVMSNAAGTALGVLAARTWRAWLLPPRARAAKLAAAGLVAFALAIGVTRLLIEPALPDSQYFGQWTAELGGMAPYAGHVESATLGGRALPSWNLAHSDSVRADLLAGLPLRLQVIAGPPPDGLAPIFSIADDRQRGIVLLGADRNDLVLRYRMRAADWRLDQPDLRVRGALAGVRPGDRLDLAVDRLGPGACLFVNGRRWCPGFGPLVGWTLLNGSSGMTRGERAAATALWAALLLVPVCYWGFRAAGRA